MAYVTARNWIRLSIAHLKARHKSAIFELITSQKNNSSSPFYGEDACVDFTSKVWRSAFINNWGAQTANPVLEALDAVPDKDIDLVCAWAEKSGNHLIFRHNRERYPQRLLSLPDAPLLLYAKGNPDWLRLPGIAIVGSRNATAYGRNLAHDHARSLAQSGLVVISGLAIGIDAAAHQGALDENGATIAVLGTGPNIIYPQKNRELAQAIASSGLILSEYPISTRPLARNFPKRNRLIAALSLGCLVVEASQSSGALITARLAADMGREIFSIPGSVHSPQSRGPHKLLREGARLVEKTMDILEELYGQLLPYTKNVADEGLKTINLGKEKSTSKEKALIEPGPNKAPINADEASDSQSNEETIPGDMHENDGDHDSILDAIPYSPVLLDDIVVSVGLPITQTHARLLELEMSGNIESLPGGRFQRIK